MKTARICVRENKHFVCAPAPIVHAHLYCVVKPNRVITSNYERWLRDTIINIKNIYIYT